MKNWSHFLEEDPKKHIAAAPDMETEKQVPPPNFNLNAESPIQAKMNSFIDVVKTPSPAGPIPIPYPNINKVKEGKEDGILSTMGSALSGAVESVNDFVGDKSNEAQDLTKSFSGSADKYLKAVKFGKQMFKLNARFSDIRIMAVSAIGVPGCLRGPDIENFIKIAPSVAKMTGEDKSMRDAVAKGVSKNFKSWSSKVTVPGLPWYPAFASFPAAHAPPTPNIPTPLIACISSRVKDIISSKEIKNAIYSELPADMNDATTEAFVTSLAIQIANFFLVWISSQQVMNVLGTGPVPSYSPPTVPTGPVINGSIISSPGHLIS